HTVLIRKDGGDIPIDDSGAPIRDRAGTLIGVVLVFRDIRERRQTEAELRAAQLRLEKTFASLDQAVLFTEADTGVVLAGNPAVTRIFGQPLEAVIGRTKSQLHVSEALYEAFMRQVHAALNESGVYHTEYQMRRADGTLFFAEHTVTEIRDE